MDTDLLVGRIGRVTVTIPTEGGGEVLLGVRGGFEAFTAYPSDPEPIASGTRVAVVEHPTPRTVVVTPC